MGLILGVVAVPAFGAVLAAALPTRVRAVTTVAATSVTVVVSLVLAGRLLRTGSDRVRLRWSDGIEVVLVADGLAVALLLAGATTALAASLFAATQREGSRASRSAYWPLSLLLLTGVHGLFLAGDLLTAYLMLELVAVTGAALVVLGGRRRELVAGARYFYAELVASISFLGGAALVWQETGTVVIGELSADVGTSPAGRWGLVLLTVGLLLKVPLVPLHFWLPGAHALAPSPVSPLLSALVVKSAFAVLVKLWFVGLAELRTPALDQLLALLGAAAVLWGGLNALRSEQVKQLLAYSTVSQLGLMFLLAPMAGVGSTEAWVGGIVQGVAHALPKAAMLMSAALLAATVGGATVAQLAGAATRRPVAVFALGLGGLSLIGLPPTVGFVAKWFLFVGSIRTGQWWWAVVIVVGSLLTAAYLARVVQACFAPAPTAAAAPVRGAGDAVALVLALTALLVGLYPDALVALVEVGAPIGGLDRG